ncbi:Permease of the drug/metabolite transporter (DMT) superfamily [Aquimarina amphilecti]|uniref:Permease of the drug/metabolite transporter (DMT) superfamily n=1 Tax=Aquimarina amphilecti TaxID=1038014 RepID=A0A1H7VG86_AQUAM|nr:DMT family transporter [Aquimarina amphilecti]SEM08292.1 Permease of the drug/metabolite transporter (DMT) superfamily [Aquimarina amphilecti]
MISNKAKAHIALLSVNMIYGANYLIAKGLMPDKIGASALVFLRISGAGLLFLILKLFIKEQAQKKDIPRLALCGLLGVATNQFFSMNGLSLTSPVDAAIIVTAMPIFTVIISYFLLKEPLTLSRILGICIGGGGAILLIYLGNSGLGTGSLKGNIFIGLNALSFAFYLVLVKPLMQKYKPITVIIWTFFFGFIFMFPLCIGQLLDTDFNSYETTNWISLIYVIIGPTFLAYLLNMFALQFVKPTVSSSYIYVQPAVAMLLVAGIAYFIIDSQYKGDITIAKLLCCSLIFIGVYLISSNSSLKWLKRK